MATQTPNYNFDLPEEGADDNLWGGFLNGNWAALDSLLKAVDDRIDQVLLGLYPVGAIYISDNDTLPPQLAALGTWARTAADVTLRGTAANGQSGQTGGGDSITLTKEVLPPHTHTVTDVGHSHGVSDPGHQHEVGGTFDIGGIGFPDAAYLLSGSNVATTAKTTGISIVSSTTGIIIDSTGDGDPIDATNSFRKTNIWVRTS